MIPAGAEFFIGSAAADITPPLTVPYLAWDPRHQPFAGVHDRLRARAVVIGTGERDDDRVAIISADLIGFANTLLAPNRNFTREVREQVRKRAGIPPERVMLTATHAHSTPDTLNFRPLRSEPGAAAWLERLIEQLADCVARAADRTFKARLTVAHGRLPGVSRNRRGEAWIDDGLTALQFASDDASRRVVLLNFTCHPVIVQVQNQLCGDFVGVAASSVEASGAEACLFLQGFCGDINPVCDDSRDFADVERIGSAVADCAARLLTRVAEPQRAQIRCVTGRVRLPSRTLPPVQAGDPLIEEYRARLDEGTGPFIGDLQVIRLGDVLLLAAPGEPFCRMGLELKQQLAPRIVVPVGYANGYLGYFVPPESWERGGYETRPGMWSKAGPESHALVRDALADLAGQADLI